MLGELKPKGPEQEASDALPKEFPAARFFALRVSENKSTPTASEQGLDAESQGQNLALNV